MAHSSIDAAPCLPRSVRKHALLPSQNQRRRRGCKRLARRKPVLVQPTHGQFNFAAQCPLLDVPELRTMKGGFGSTSTIHNVLFSRFAQRTTTSNNKTVSMIIITALADPNTFTKIKNGPESRMDIGYHGMSQLKRLRGELSVDHDICRGLGFFFLLQSPHPSIAAFQFK